MKKIFKKDLVANMKTTLDLTEVSVKDECINRIAELKQSESGHCNSLCIVENSELNLENLNALLWNTCKDFDKEDELQFLNMRTATRFDSYGIERAIENFVEVVGFNNLEQNKIVYCIDKEFYSEICKNGGFEELICRGVSFVNADAYINEGHLEQLVNNIGLKLTEQKYRVGAELVISPEEIINKLDVLTFDNILNAITTFEENFSSQSAN